MLDVIEPLYGELRKDSEFPPGGDNVIAAFSKAMAEELSANDQVQETLARIIEAKRLTRPFPPSYATNFSLRLFQMELLDEPSYPEDFIDSDIWKFVIASVFSDDKKRNEFEIHMRIFNVQSNVAERYIGPKLVARVLQQPDDKGNYSILDVGCSRNHGISWIDANLEPLGLKLMEGSTEDPSYSEDLTDHIKSLSTQRLRLDHSYGIDLWPLDDPLMARWQEACSFYPLELTAEGLRERYHYLEKHRDSSDHIHFVQANFAYDKLSGRETAARSASIPNNKKFDLIVFSTIWYQLNPDQQRAMLNRAIRRLKRNGKIVLQDFCTVDPVNTEDAIAQLNFPENWRKQPYGYKTLVYDEDVGFRVFGSWSTGRCKELILGELAMESIT